MDQESSIAKILWTSDYDKFSFLKGNRNLVPSKLKKLSRDVENGLDLFKYCPILVNSSFHIIDGQHRFYVCHHKSLPIYYTIVPDITLAQIAKLNNNQNKWSNSNFMDCYITAGANSEHYKQLEEFCSTHKINLSLGVGLLYSGTGNTSGESMEAFRNGLFEVRFMDPATQLLEKAKDYEPFCDSNTSRPFLIALKRLLESNKFSQLKMIEKLQVHELKIEKRSNPKDYMAHFEELFNFKNSKRQTIY